MGDVAAAALTWPLTRPLIETGERMYLHPSTRIRRCLFGPVDHGAMKVTLEEGYRELYQKDKLRWNFDFEQSRPLPAGRYSWEKVRDDTSDADSNGGSATEEEEEGKKQLPAKLDAKQTRITDFMRKRKSSNLNDDSLTQRPKTRRRSST